jgi:hypothetical protein
MLIDIGATCREWLRVTTKRRAFKRCLSKYGTELLLSGTEPITLSLLEAFR